MSSPYRTLNPLVCVLVLSAALGGACARDTPREVSDADRAAIADTLRNLIASAYDFSRGDVVKRLMSLYPQEGPVISAAAGRVVTSRDSLEQSIRWFWENVGSNMRDARWTWGQSHVHVLSPDAAVLTAAYRISHLTPEGRPHIVGGAWTALFLRRDGRWVIVQEHLSDAPEEHPDTLPDRDG